MNREECPWGTHPKTRETPLAHRLFWPTSRPCGIRAHPILCLRATAATVLLVKVPEEIIMGSLLTNLVPYSGEALLNSHHIQFLSVSCLASYEILLLTTPHIAVPFTCGFNS